MEILTERQRAVISLIARSPLRQEFFFTGGTALSACYLQHRYSDDLDFFTENRLAVPHDEDELCLEPSLFLKRTIRTAGLWVIPKTGHTVNLEEPDLFNRAVQEFWSAVEAGRWSGRDPRSIAKSALLADEE